MVSIPRPETPVTEQDRAFWRAREDIALREAMLTDSELAAYRIEVARLGTDQRQRGAPQWVQEWTQVRLVTIQVEIARRERLAKHGAPRYAPEEWWVTFVEHVREVARADVLKLLVEDGFLPDPRRRARSTDVWGLCPLHQENTPSFHVDLDTGLWNCFGCGTGGDVFTWLEIARGVDFITAVKALAARYHIPEQAPPREVERYHIPDDEE